MQKKRIHFDISDRLNAKHIHKLHEFVSNMYTWSHLKRGQPSWYVSVGKLFTVGSPDCDHLFFMLNPLSLNKVFESQMIVDYSS